MSDRDADARKGRGLDMRLRAPPILWWLIGGALAAVPIWYFIPDANVSLFALMGWTSVLGVLLGLLPSD